MRKILIFLLIMNALFIPVDIIMGNPWVAPINIIGAISCWIGLISLKKI